MQIANRRNIGIVGALWVIAVSADFDTHYSFSSPRPGQEKEQLKTAHESAMTNAAIDRISEESRGGLQELTIEAPPRSSSSPALSEHTGGDSPPSPPYGYSFVSYQGEMARERVESQVGAAGAPLARKLDWLGSATSIERLATQAAAAGRDWSFGWIRLAGNSRADDLARALQGTGARIIGASGVFVRARLPGDEARLQAIAGLPEVDGLGALPWETKLARTLANQARNAPPQQQAPVFITLMSDDPDGRWRRELEGMGAVVGRFDPDLRAYAANVSYARLETIAAADFVLAIDPVGIYQAAHDTAVPAMAADALRRYDGAPGLFSGVGGASVPIGVMDTGLNINHLDIVSNRESICGANFAWFGPGGPLGESEDLWIDEFGHGTHVTGTILGNGSVETRFAGMAPSVRHIRFAKVLNIHGFGSGDGVARGMDFLARPTACADAGSPSAPVKPLIVNMSLSATSRTFEGRGVGARKLDSVVWSHRQLYVVAQSNAGISGFSNYASAKNSLAVGAVMDSGDIAAFSSHGPTFDGRLAPQVVATGVRLHSARGAGSRGGYVSFSGTSMSSPATAGVAALLMDAVPAFREQPALTRARLMASAIRPDVWLEDAAVFPATNTGGPGRLHDQYGLGKVSARTSVLNRDRADGWSGGGAISELRDGEYAYQDILVPEGASRLDLVLAWDEPPTDAIASAVLNDLDLWLDRDGDCGAVACGEQVSSSRVDNVEWIILRNPQPGVYRAKGVAHRIYTAPPRAALAWTVIRGASTPNLRIEADSATLESGREQELTLTVSADAYLAAGTRLHIDCRDTGGSSGCNQAWIRTVGVSREDGVTVETSGVSLGSSIPLGEVSVGEIQQVKLAVRYRGESDAVRLYFTASAWNAKLASVSVGFGSGSEELSDTAGPPNDDLAAAAVIEGEKGSLPLDLLLATPEPGEPLFTPWDGRPAGSVWYTWTAPANGPARFNIPPPVGYQDHRNDRLSVFRGDRILALEQIADGPWGATFFAEQGHSYRIRVSNFKRGASLNLRWSQGPRPANDDFTQAAVLEGPEGVVEGNSQGATLETGEWFGSSAATTWYRWTAPSDGLWQFRSTDPRRIFVFENDSIDALRLVSGFPNASAIFPAGGGKEYRIAVAEPNAYSSGSPYQLSWSSLDSRSNAPPNDDIVDAEPMAGTASSEHLIGIDRYSTVEPGEPVETGVRTKWWVWQAPEDGYYTWRLTDSGEGAPQYSKLQVTVFNRQLHRRSAVGGGGRPGRPLRSISCCGPRAGNDIGWRPDFRQEISRHISSTWPPPE